MGLFLHRFKFKFKSLPRYQLSDLHTWARSDGFQKIFGWITGMRSLSLTQSMWNKTSPPFCSHLSVVLEHERSINTYDAQRPATITFLTLNCFSNQIFSSMLPSHLLPLWWTMQIHYGVVFSPSPYGQTLNDKTTVHILVSSWGKNHNLGKYIINI